MRTGAELQVGFLGPPLPCTVACLPALRTGGTAVVIHLGRISDDSDTNFPSQVSIFFTITVLEELVLMWLKKSELLPKPKLAWKPRP